MRPTGAASYSKRSDTCGAKTLPSGKAGRLTQPTRWNSIRSIHQMAGNIVFVEWNDEHQAQIRRVSLDGSVFRTLFASAGVLRSPAFSRDGTKLVFEISEGDRCLGGHERHSGFVLDGPAGR